MKQILPEFFLAHPRFQIAVRRHYDANIDANWFVAADALNFAFFEHAQQLRLHVQRHVADFVQKNRSLIGLLKLADVASGRAGERALLMSEKFRLDQLRRHGRAIQSDEGPGSARAAFVNGSCDQFFACAGFAEDAHACFAGGDALQLRHHAPHSFALPHNFVLAELLAELPVLAFQALQFERVLDGEHEFVAGDRLLQEVERSQTRRPHRHFNVRLSRHHDYRRASLPAASIPRAASGHLCRA